MGEGPGWVEADQTRVVKLVATPVSETGGRNGHGGSSPSSGTTVWLELVDTVGLNPAARLGVQVRVL